MVATSHKETVKNLSSVWGRKRPISVIDQASLQCYWLLGVEQIALARLREDVPWLTRIRLDFAPKSIDNVLKQRRIVFVNVTHTQWIMVLDSTNWPGWLISRCSRRNSRSVRLIILASAAINCPCAGLRLRSPCRVERSRLWHNSAILSQILEW